VKTRGRALVALPTNRGLPQASWPSTFVDYEEHRAEVLPHTAVSTVLDVPTPRAGDLLTTAPTTQFKEPAAALTIETIKEIRKADLTTLDYAYGELAESQNRLPAGLGRAPTPDDFRRTA